MTPFVSPGLHLLIDFWKVENMGDATSIEHALRAAARACGATVLDVMLHSFGEGAGITGVAILAESHISIHTWPEMDYVALDVFMCGSCNPHHALPILRAAFNPTREQVSEHCRGVMG